MMNPEHLIETAAILSPEQAELLGALLEERGEEFGAFPLSFAQQRLWFLDRLNPGGAAYNIAGAIEIRGALDRAVLGTALAEIVRRHEILRTVFLELQGKPLQVVREWIDVPLVEVDLAGLPPERRRQERDALAFGETSRPFDLARGPLLRTVLLTAAAGEHTLVLALHHIVSDGWSSRLLAREIAALYEAFLAGRPSPLPELPLQYGDYARWQREWLRGVELERLLAAARPRLAGLPALELPADHRRPAVQSLRGRRLPWGLSGTALAGLRGFCEREGVTLFVGLAAAFAALLSRLGGQRDLALGAPSANRDRVEIEPLIGCFVNTLVLRFDLAAEPGYRELVRQARQVVLDAFALRELPFEKLVEELEVGRSLSHAPLVQAMIALQNVELDPVLPGLELRLRDVDNGTAKLDLTLSLTEEGGDLRGWLEHSTDLFETATVLRLAGSFERLLEGALADPGQPFVEIPLLSVAEAQQVLREWSATGAEVGEGCLHELFAAQVARTPEAPALVAGEERLTYRELDRRAEVLARRLRALGVGPEVLVGVFLERTSWLVAGLLGILKAGGAYVPLDPAHPRQRVASTLKDSRAWVVLAQGRLAERLPALGIPVLLVDAGDAEEVAEDETAPLASGVGPEHLAYVIYTSGSTGIPKGVAIRHGSAAARIGWAAARYGAAELAGVLASTSITFDLSVFELFVPLCLGGTVLLAEDALALPSLPAAREVTLVNTVPSAMEALVRTGAVPGSVRVVNLAGEALRRDLVEQVQALPGVEAVYNLYGPSEDTTYSTAAPVPPGEGAPAIGRPLPGSRAHVLDAHLRPAPIGVAAELWLGGQGLARGYVHRPDLTADRFRPDPLATLTGEAGARLYRTGDLCRWRPGGELEFLGRIDQQVKVRGHRIELGEVEAALAELPEVREAVVVLREEPAGGGGLVAYVALQPDALPTAAPLRGALEARLPRYMVPPVWVLLEALPRTPNGKVDRRALPVPPGGEPAAAYQGPRTAEEEVVVGLWAELLGREQVGIADDFFALGGHSLLAAQLTARLRAVLGVELPVRAVFEHPTAAALADAVEQA
ncbi:MAG TPA: amino acid adenylation domain-containing protein, partial [Thermoanaerobaculia bacterium]|nr:amino acid adenylation domain-containing protein [Thermoanaerobaculia bacterium]